MLTITMLGKRRSEHATPADNSSRLRIHCSGGYLDTDPGVAVRRRALGFNITLLLSLDLSFILFETGFPYIAQGGLKLMILLPQLPK